MCVLGCHLIVLHPRNVLSEVLCPAIGTGSVSFLTTRMVCRHHPVYVLERHIGRYFALKPGTKKVGMHRGEGYYPRDALAELHTADRYHCPSCRACECRVCQSL